jgi:ATP-binding cassette subfamily C protein
MLTPILTQTIFDTIIPGAQHKQLLQVFAFLIASAVATAMLQLARSFATWRLEGRMDAAVQTGIWDRLLSLPAPFFRNFTASHRQAIRAVEGVVVACCHGSEPQIRLAGGDALCAATLERLGPY